VHRGLPFALLISSPQKNEVPFIEHFGGQMQEGCSELAEPCVGGDVNDGGGAAAGADVDSREDSPSAAFDRIMR
jgi:hypothetical protein